MVTRGIFQWALWIHLLDVRVPKSHMLPELLVLTSALYRLGNSDTLPVVWQKIFELNGGFNGNMELTGVVFQQDRPPKTSSHSHMELSYNGGTLKSSPFWWDLPL